MDPRCLPDKIVITDLTLTQPYKEMWAVGDPQAKKVATGKPVADGRWRQCTSDEVAQLYPVYYKDKYDRGLDKAYALGFMDAVEKMLKLMDLTAIEAAQYRKQMSKNTQGSEE